MLRSLVERLTFKRPSARPETSSAAAKVEVILRHPAWRRVVLVGTSGAVVAFISGILTELPNGLTFDSVIYGVSASVLLGIASVLLFNPKSLKTVTTLLIAASGSFFLFRLIHLLFGTTPATQIPQQLTESFFWVPVVYVVGYLVPGLTLGRKLALATNLGLLFISCVYVLATIPETNMQDFEALFQLNLANLTFAYAVRSFSIYREATLEAYAKGEVLTRLAYTDALTGLANRLQFERRLQETLTVTKTTDLRVAVVFIDLDHFKRVNDTLGHKAGDELLVSVAERLQLNVRTGDLLARLGGDEFVLMLPQLRKLEDAAPMVADLRGLFEHPFKLSTGTLKLSASLGLSIFPDDADSAELLLERSDLAMYKEKAFGRKPDDRSLAGDESVRQLN